MFFREFLENLEKNQAMNFMKKFLLLLFALVPGLCIANDLNVQVDASFVKLRQGTYISFNLKNNSDRDIKVYRHTLPWEHIYSTFMVAYATDNVHTEIGKVFPISDPEFDSTVIKSGTIVSGKIDLSRIFPSLNKALKKDDVMIFWSYVLKSFDGEVSKRFGGMVAIPKNPG